MWCDRVTQVVSGAVGVPVAPAESFGSVGVDVPVTDWASVVRALRDEAGCTFFDWLSAVDELAEGFRVVCHLATLLDHAVDHVVVRTLVPRDTPAVASLVPLFAGAAWHERETHEMFGIDFTGGVEPAGLLLPEGFEGHPLRKEFVLASRVAKPWPGAKEPGESDHETAAPSRRRTRPPGVPEPSEWGPRDPGSQAPDPLAHARPAPAGRPRRSRKAAQSEPDGV